FYIQNAFALEGLDPEIPDNLPPDLVIEVDITSPSTRRLEIYQALGITEVWRYTKREGLAIYQLQGDAYRATENSLVFSALTAVQLNDFLTQRQSQTKNQVIRAVRSWVQTSG
ncbi:MAG: Uma2 family endonuclease, partial [Leptolyngbya sp. SIO3F4]|nr:Uma2 family endonuclease [Leptolyngbya sp. SIO3F4]